MESVDDESAVDAAALPLAQAKTSVEHVVLQQDALAHPEDLHHSGDVEDNNMLMMISHQQHITYLPTRVWVRCLFFICSFGVGEIWKASID